MITHPVLGGLARFGVRMGVDRLERFLAHLGDPHKAFPIVHVGGTNGKGSVVRMVAAMLRAYGLRVGEYTSPHLQQVNERIRVDGCDIDDAALDDLLHRLDRERHEWMRRDEAALGDDQPVPSHALTYFEMMTAVGFVYLAGAGVDVGVVEVGLGGRLDATNVVDPAVSAIVSVGLDHTEQLGPDVASIAAEKAGIVKPGRPVVVGPLPPAAMRVVRAIAHQRDACLLAPAAGYRVQAVGGHDAGAAITYSDEAGTLRDVELALAGGHQVDNAGVAIAAVRHLPARLVPEEAAIRRGLAQVRHAGRLEWLGPDLLVDCAHNVDGAIRLAAFLDRLPRDRPRTLLLGASEDKDVRAMVVPLGRRVDRVLTTHCDHPRATPAGELAARLVGVDVPVLPAGPVVEALDQARSREGLLVVAGSVFLVGAVRDLVGAH